MNDSLGTSHHDSGNSGSRPRPKLVLLNYLGAWTATVLTAFGFLVSMFGGFLFMVPGALLIVAAGPLAAAFWLAAVGWKRRWRHARVVQLLPVVVMLAWAALLLSPVESRPPAP